MANSDPNEMRIRRLEQSVVQITTILVEQGERTDAGFNLLHKEIHGVRSEVHDLRGEVNGLRGEVNGLRGEVNGLRGDMNTMREAITDRLDRLITVTVQARTHDIERFADIERRLARLEGRVGV
jgi:archaellum component FlaC